MALTRERAIDFVKKLRKQAASEFSLGNEGAAELFTEKANEIFETYSLSDNDFAVEKDVTFQIINELGKTIISNPFLRANAKSNLHQEWFSLLAEEVAGNYKCKTCPRVQSGEVSFYGYDLDREMATFIFLRLADVAERLSKKELPIARKNVGKPAMKDFATKEEITFPQIWHGDESFFNSFHMGFRKSLQELHEKQQNGIIPQEVLVYFDQNKHLDYQGYSTNHSCIDIIPEYVRIGARCGRVAFKKSTSSTALVSKKTQQTIKSVVEGHNRAILLIDTSGSMRGSKIDSVLEGAKKFAVDAIAQDYQVGIITFDSSARVIIEPSFSVEQIEDALNKIHVGGCTNMEAGIRTAIPYFSFRRKKNRLCVVTDGKPETWSYNDVSDVELALNAASDAKKLGIEILAVGTDDAEEEFLRKLCSREGMALLVDKTQLQLTMGEMAGNLK
jgi:Mg-chelatase subunit ChlD